MTPLNVKLDVNLGTHKELVVTNPNGQIVARVIVAGNDYPAHVTVVVGGERTRVEIPEE